MAELSPPPSRLVQEIFRLDWPRYDSRAALRCLPAMAIALGFGLMVHEPAGGIVAATGTLAAGLASSRRLQGSQLLPMILTGAAAAGAAKPDARIFAHLRRAAGALPLEILHVGDDPLADVVGATQAGMQAVWLNRGARSWPAEFAPPPRTVSTLADIF